MPHHTTPYHAHHIEQCRYTYELAFLHNTVKKKYDMTGPDRTGQDWNRYETTQIQMQTLDVDPVLLCFALLCCGLI